MNTKQLSNLLKDTYDRLVKLSASKGEEYTQGKDERLSNFLDGAERTGVTPLQYLFIAMDKHYNAVANYVKDSAKGKSREVSEPIDGRLLDLILYSTLARALIPQTVGDLPPGSKYGEGAPTGPIEPMPGPGQNGAFGIDPSRFVRVVATDRPKYLDPRVVEEDTSDSIRSLQRLVGDWARRAFPSRSLDTVRLKLTTHEMPELLVSLGAKKENAKIPGEIADVMILLLDYCEMRGIDLNAEIRSKMKINEGRQWLVDDHGISSHVDETTAGGAPTTPTSPE